MRFCIYPKPALFFANCLRGCYLTYNLKILLVK